MPRAACPDADLVALLLALQRHLFVLGAELATRPERRHHLQDGVSRVTAAMVAELEVHIDRLVAERPLRPVFIVPGATASAVVDHALAVARRTEHHVLAASATGHP